MIDFRLINMKLKAIKNGANLAPFQKLYLYVTLTYIVWTYSRILLT